MKKIILFLFGTLLLLSPAIYAAVDATTNIPLPAEQAFELTVDNSKPDVVSAHWQIAPGYYLYRDHFHFELSPDTAGSLKNIPLPKGIEKQDEILGKYEAYEHEVTIKIPIPKHVPANTTLTIHYQGCASSGFCYPPVTREIALTSSADTNVTAAPDNKNNAAATTHASSSSLMSEQDRTQQLLSSGNYLWIFLSFFGFGILLTFTPCVLPMIPILSGIIVGQNKSLSTRRAFNLSLAYVLTMAFTYAGAGILAGYLGSDVQALLQNRWIIIAFSIVFVVLALSTFGLFEIRMPNRIHHHIINMSNKQKGGTYLGVIIMGFLSTLIVSPCVTPPLVGALSYIAQSGNAILGGAALFSLGLGMGVPLLIIGTTEGKFLPKSGPWMDFVKSLFGILMLGVAIWLIARIVSPFVTMLLWAALCLGTAIYLRQFKSESHRIRIIIINLSFISFFYGLLIILGAIMGNTDPLRPIYFPDSLSSVNNESLQFTHIKSLDDLNNQLKNAKEHGQFVIVDFYADWCIACKEMEKETFGNPQVIKMMKNFVLLQADITAYDATDQALARKLEVIAPPTLLFYDKDGNELTRARIVGKMAPQEFIKHLNMVLQNS